MQNKKWTRSTHTHTTRRGRQVDGDWAISSTSDKEWANASSGWTRTVRGYGRLLITEEADVPNPGHSPNAWRTDGCSPGGRGIYDANDYVFCVCVCFCVFSL